MKLLFIGLILSSFPLSSLQADLDAPVEETAEATLAYAQPGNPSAMFTDAYLGRFFYDIQYTFHPRPFSTPAMKLMIVGLAWAAYAVSQPLSGQSPATSPPVMAASRPELDQLVASYEEQQKAIDAEVDLQRKPATDRYAAELDALIKKFNQSKRPGEADKVHHEAERFAAHGTNGEPAKSMPPEVRSAWTALLHDTSTAPQSVTLKRNALRARFDQDLTAVELSFRNRNDTVGISLTRRARALTALRGASEAGRLAVSESVGRGDDRWQDVPQEGGYIVGFDLGKGGWFQFSVLGSMKPIFATARGVRDGERRGASGGKRIVAKDGYAVGGIMVRNGDVVNNVQIIFMRINPDNISLNPQDFYYSDWVGGEGGGKPKEINLRGRLIVGVSGKSGGIVDTIALVYLK